MSTQSRLRGRETTRLILDPPTFSPPREMRAQYLENHRAELDGLAKSARAGEWKRVQTIANHIRGTGAMYGFPNMGEAAENLGKAIENGYANCLEYVDAYVKAVNESYV